MKSRFDRNTPFNNLPLLPPIFELENSPQVLKKLVTASRALASVNANMMRLPNPFMLVNTISLQEAKTSTEIENIFTTEDELYKAISDSANEDNANPATKEVLRYREAIWAGYRSIMKKNTITLKSIEKIFQIIKKTSTGIRSPQSMVVIKRGASEFRPGEIIYTPPRGKGVIEKYMKNFTEYLNDDKKYNTDPLIKMCVSHYQFEAIHPFQDGNGRAGRVLNQLYLVNKGLLSQPTLYLSKYIIVKKDEYYYNLGAVTQRGAWKEWVLFMLDAVEKTSAITNNIISEILNQMEATLKYGKAKISWYSKELNDAIFNQPYIKARIIGEITGKTSRTTITGYVKELCDAKILAPKKMGVETYYLNNDLIRILQGNN
ncbi:MAG: Fic/DOC family N-terminal domain-containing protein [Bacteroidales bacterium]|nr:Fic/DOC family N-terminal domain-containing protein [Bacteroidales bacterium]